MNEEGTNAKKVLNALCGFLGLCCILGGFPLTMVSGRSSTEYILIDLFSTILGFFFLWVSIPENRFREVTDAE